MSKKEINFYYRKADFGWLSNFWRSSQIVDGIEYQSNEHYYQSQKAMHEEVQKWIREAPSPYLAMKAGRSLRSYEMIDNWDDKKVEVMLRGLRAKFAQNKELSQKIIATGDAILHEDSPIDMFWGKRGEDMLGKLLMQIRQELQEERI